MVQWLYSSSRPEVSVKKVHLNILQNSQDNTCARVFFNKVKGLSMERLKCFPVHFAKSLTTSFLTEHFRSLLLMITSMKTHCHYQANICWSSTRLQCNNFTSCKTSSKRKNCYAEDVFKTSSRHVLKTSWRHVLKMSLRHVLKTS